MCLQTVAFIRYWQRGVAEFNKEAMHGQARRIYIYIFLGGG